MAGAGFDEDAHPRDEKGKFSGGGGGADKASGSSKEKSLGERLSTWAAYRDDLKNNIASLSRAAATAQRTEESNRQMAQSVKDSHGKEGYQREADEMKFTAKEYTKDKEKLESRLREHMKGQPGTPGADVYAKKEAASGNKHERRAETAPVSAYRLGLAAAEKEKEKNFQRSFFGKEQKRENERRESVGKPPMIPGSREHKEFVDKARAQMRSTRRPSSTQTSLPFAS